MERKNRKDQHSEDKTQRALLSEEFKQWKSSLPIGRVINFTSKTQRHNFACICRVAADCKCVVATILGLSAKIIEYFRFSAKRNDFFAKLGVMDGLGKNCSFDHLDHDIKKGAPPPGTVKN